MSKVKKKRKNTSEIPIIVGNPMDPMGLNQYMHRYFEWMQIKNYSPKTIETREVYLSQFIHWCDQRGLIRPGEITKPIVERYQRYLFHYRKKNGDPLSFRNQATRLVAVRAWFKWLTKENYILYNPASDIEMPKIEKRLPKAVLSEREAEAILNQPDLNTHVGIRDRAILETFYSTGIRRTELTNLGIQDIDADRGVLTVRQGKGKKDRVIPIGERAILWVEKYLYEIRPELVCNIDGGTLFLSSTGEKLHPGSMTKLVSDYVKQSKISKKGSCHMFRHTMATLMLENGADVRFIQAMLGHVKLETTEIYTQVSIKKLKQIHTLTHPAKAHRTKKVDWNEEPTTEHDIMQELHREEQEEKGELH